MENKIYKEAILDAKALRAGAIANAKSIMQEALEPAIQEMMRLKLSEELEENLEEDLEEGYEEEGATYEEGTQEEGYEEEGAMKDEAMYDEDADKEITDESLEEILAELDELEKHEEGAINEEEEEEEEEESIEADEEEEGTEDEEEVSDETKVIQLTLGDLKAALMAPQAGEEAGEEPSEERPVSLDEILAELEEEENKTSKEEGKHEEEESIKTELELAKETIETLQESIKEINLLNAKLLYMNKIFKAKSLTESDKIKVVKAFDRNTTVNEVKNTYETLKESLRTPKSQIKESVGFASKPIGVAPKSNIVEADAFVSRWQKIAGIK